MSDDHDALFDVLARRDAYGRQTHFVPNEHLQRTLDNSGDWWRSLARQAITAIAETYSTFTVDDLRRDGVCPDPPNGPQAWGAAIAAAANDGLITCVGYRKSKRKETHGRIVSVWTRGDTPDAA